MNSSRIILYSCCTVGIYLRYAVTAVLSGISGKSAGTRTTNVIFSAAGGGICGSRDRIEKEKAAS